MGAPDLCPAAPPHLDVVHGPGHPGLGLLVDRAVPRSVRTRGRPLPDGRRLRGRGAGHARTRAGAALRARHALLAAVPVDRPVRERRADRPALAGARARDRLSRLSARASVREGRQVGRGNDLVGPDPDVVEAPRVVERAEADVSEREGRIGSDEDRSLHVVEEDSDVANLPPVASEVGVADGDVREQA